MSVKVVSMSTPGLAFSIYSDRTEISRSGSLPRPAKGIYFVKENEPIKILREELMLFADDVVAVSPREIMGSDLSLSQKEHYIGEVASERGLRPAKDVVRKTEHLSPEDFETFIRYSCVLRRWYREIFERVQDSPYMLFESLVSDKKEFLSQYFFLRRSRSPREILSAVVTFLTRVDLYEDQKDSLSLTYRALVRKGKNQGMQFLRAAKILLRCPEAVDWDSQVIQFCLSLRS